MSRKPSGRKPTSASSSSGGAQSQNSRTTSASGDNNIDNINNTKDSINNNNNGPTILFTQSHNEVKTLSNNYKLLHNKLRTEYRVISHTAELTKDKINNINPKLIVLPGSRNPLTQNEEFALRDYMIAGGSCLIIVGEGSINESSQQFDNFTHFNPFLSQFSIQINNDSVVRTIYAPEFFHPKEALINYYYLLSSLLLCLIGCTSSISPSINFSIIS